MKVIENRKKYYALSCVVIGLGVLFMVINMFRGQGAFSKDIQFTGGSLIQVDVKQNFSNDIKDDIQKIATEVTGHTNISITSAGDTGVIITMPQTDTDVRTKLFETIKEKYNLEDTDLAKDVDVSASISKEIKSGAIKAVIVGAILILIYITFRFKDYRFGTSAVVALLHDVMIMLAAYAIFRVPLNNSFIAAMLTIVGYSINDTIVVFDRIRENKVKKGLKDHDGAPIELVDDSVNQTVGRSISTSVTTLIMVVLLFILGTESVKEFAFPLIIGVLAGTYSSIFIASPLWYDLTHFGAKKSTRAKKVNKKKA
ncbi:MAG: protein translocase subunit SecF [Cellulosilyticum sp.]|nr:protein translocase subunit SecF [Cellulosilyticum sp.]